MDGSASAKGIAAILEQERQYVAANQGPIATQFARDPDKRAEAMAEVARTLTFAMVMSLNDDAERGRQVKQLFNAEIERMAIDQAECDAALHEPNPVSQHTGD